MEIVTFEGKQGVKPLHTILHSKKSGYINNSSGHI